MKATDVIARDHRAAEDLFEQFKAAAPEEREPIVKNIFRALDTHENMEDEHFYPALKDKAGDDATIDQIEREQAELKMEVMGVRAMDFVAGESDERITNMMEKVLAHAHKEESTIFPKAEELLSSDELEAIGEAMEPDSAVANA